jgi:probable F420-dependent oxidoreductase
VRASPERRRAHAAEPGSSKHASAVDDRLLPARAAGPFTQVEPDSQLAFSFARQHGVASPESTSSFLPRRVVRELAVAVASPVKKAIRGGQSIYPCSVLSFGVTILPDPPWQRLVELVQLAEQHGFDYAWTYDSHILWQEPYPLLTLAAANTERIRLGLNVTNPGTREPTVTASAFATLQDVSGGRMVMGIGRGDSARRVIGQKPVGVADFEAACTMIRELMNGRPVRWNDTDVELAWAKGRPEIPLYVAGYGPRVLAIAGRVADGVIIQLADPEIIEWIVGQVRAAAEQAGRDPAEITVVACAPAHVSDDLAEGCEQVRWFPAMVSNHVFDVLSRHDPAELPAALTDYVSRMQRERYDYSEHSRVGAKHGEQITDETCERFCILGPAGAHVEKLRRLEAAGVDQWNIYLMTQGQEETLRVYGETIIPALAAEAVPPVSG